MIFEKIQEIIVEQLGIDKNEIKLESNFQEDLDADSLDLFQIVMALEEAFDLEIPTEDMENIKTVQDAVNYIESKQDKQE
ncbi:MAG: acyl carrier protein [Epulopiscium sp.]|uniref:acyl carrier protein n=1 Tax=Defluviitalea raffinosedens TaxID=1450156 RepID=UPI00175E9EC8|nr:acyl carrier protein [Defluviitalea raffinosedens]MBM7685054.1 acyl carrier protein [Defluviitalea raffinosedens]MBZ4666875.1 acyl carrier protein [Defluviitaleaceae bacterium]MDK2786948.1 acyl carrier protein [Candidatus Epulonipiscium sp.]HHW67482.1 acyl carrier protein [Candidatus Epulonipiscium sp.]